MISSAPDADDTSADGTPIAPLAFALTLTPLETQPEEAPAAAATSKTPLPQAPASAPAAPDPNQPEIVNSVPPAATSSHTWEPPAKALLQSTDEAKPDVAVTAAPEIAYPSHALFNSSEPAGTQPRENAPAPQPAPEAAPETPATPTPLAQPAAAHDIKLQVAAADGAPPIEVRLTERAGDVMVSVRTPDTRLAGELRQDLPALSARLEQSGYHTSAWQPAGEGERQRWAEPQAAASGQDAQGQPRQNGRESQRDPQQQKQKGADDSAGPSQQKKQGQDFAWLLSSIH